jgi:hypothetical protein
MLPIFKFRPFHPSSGGTSHRALQVVVLKRGFVYLSDEHILVRIVGTGRIKMLWALFNSDFPDEFTIFSPSKMITVYNSSS